MFTFPSIQPLASTPYKEKLNTYIFPLVAVMGAYSVYSSQPYYTENLTDSIFSSTWIASKR